jgi:hypothetical protein
MTFEAVTPESLDAAAARMFAPDEEVPDGPGEEPAAGEGEAPEGDGDVLDGGPQEDDEPDVEAAPGPEEPAEEPEPEPEPAAPSAFHFADLGVTVDADLARNYALFENYLQQNPAVAEAISQALAGPQAPPAPPPPQAETVPPELDLDDPRDRWFIERLQTLGAQQSQLGATLAAHQQAISSQQADVARGIVEGAVRIFQEQKNLSAKEIEEIRAVAGRIQLPDDAYVNPTAAITNNLEQAYWTIPKYREKALTEAKGELEAGRKRQRKLSAVTGTSGSVSRSAPEPKTPHDRKEAMRAAIHEIWQGNAINE